MAPALVEAKKTDPMQFDLQCDIVTSAYEHAMKNCNEYTKQYMRELMESYGIERPVQ